MNEKRFTTDLDIEGPGFSVIDGEAETYDDTFVWTGLDPREAREEAQRLNQLVESGQEITPGHVIGN